MSAERMVVTENLCPWTDGQLLGRPHEADHRAPALVA
jgi:hypothetical protein